MWNWSENQINLLLIRHGATKANKEHRYLGKTDESLSIEGIEELQREKNADGYPDIDVLFSSPMKRCLETAGILYPGKDAIIVPEWEEMDFGAFEGNNYMDLKGDKQYQEWIDSNGTLPFPEGESREDFNVRCEKGFHRMLRELQALYSGDNCKDLNRVITVGSIVHGGTIMSLLSRLYGGEYFDYQVANGKWYLCKLGCSEEKSP